MKFVVKVIDANQDIEFWDDEADDAMVSEIKELDGHLALCALGFCETDIDVAEMPSSMLGVIITQPPASPNAVSHHELMARAFGGLGEDVYWHRMLDRECGKDRLMSEIDIRTPEAAAHTIALIKGWLVEMLEAEWPVSAS